MSHAVRAAQGLLDLLFPPTCRLCGLVQASGAESPFCSTCAAGLRPETGHVCPHCACTIGPFASVENGCPQCVDKGFQFHGALRMGRYAGPLRDAILRMKALSGADLAETLGRHWVRQHAADFRAEPIHFIIPVPLYWSRRWQRGYNQAHAIAQAMAWELRVPCRPHWLRRVRHAPAQHLLSVTARRDNVKGAFQARPRRELHDRTVLLVDDVMTTGTTCSEAAKALRAVRVKRVVVAVLARAENHPSGP